MRLNRYAKIYVCLKDDFVIIKIVGFLLNVYIFENIHAINNNN